mgnify:CR=1 FL=1
MIKNLSINDAIFGLVWCVAAKDNKKIGFTQKNKVSDTERNFLQNIPSLNVWGEGTWMQI